MLKIEQLNNFAQKSIVPNLKKLTNISFSTSNVPFQTEKLETSYSFPAAHSLRQRIRETRTLLPAPF